MSAAAPIPRSAERRACFLGVERSAAGKRWEDRLRDPRLALALSQRLGLPEIVGRVLAARGVALDEAENFLEPSLRAWLPDPSRLKDMDAAVARFARALAAGETIALFGDYDVDGATSSALLTRFLRAAGAEPLVHIPDRMKDGYGPNRTALLKLKAAGAGVVVTLDCGISAFEPLAAAAEAGLDVIVLDHHVATPELPRAHAVVNPNRLDEPKVEDDPNRLGYLAAVGVTYLLVVALNRALRESGWYRRSGRSEPDLLAWLDLVALGTVCDVVPLTGLNRALVRQGLKVIGARGNPGLAALADVARLAERPDSYHLGFILGPRVNAGGRVGEAPLGARLLATDDPAEAADIARRLDRYNEERRAIEAAVLEQAIAQVEAAGPVRGLILVAETGWHPGVVGIVASRLKERYNLPALVVALDPEGGPGRGSGRSVPGVDLGAAVIAARQAELLVNGGGHPMAAGLTVEPERLEDLGAFLSQRLETALAEVDYRPSLGLDGALQPGAATLDLVRQFALCGPYGTGNAQPRFALPAVRVAFADVVGERHVRCSLEGSDGARLAGIAFRALDGELGALLLGRGGGRPLHVAGRLALDSWGGRERVQMIVEDAAPAAD